MANTPPHLIAGGNIRPHRFVKLDSSEEHQGLEADANEAVIGISGPATKFAQLEGYSTNTNHAEDGDEIHLKGDGEICQLEAGGTVTAGDYLKSDADGKGVVIASSGTTLQRYGAIALQDGASGELIRVQVNIGSERPAIA